MDAREQSRGKQPAQQPTPPPELSAALQQPDGGMTGLMWHAGDMWPFYNQVCAQPFSIYPSGMIVTAPLSMSPPMLHGQMSPQQQLLQLQLQQQQQQLNFLQMQYAQALPFLLPPYAFAAAPAAASTGADTSQGYDADPPLAVDDAQVADCDADAFLASSASDADVAAQRAALAGVLQRELAARDAALRCHLSYRKEECDARVAALRRECDAEIATVQDQVRSLKLRLAMLHDHKLDAVADAETLFDEVADRLERERDAALRAQTALAATGVMSGQRARAEIASVMRTLRGTDAGADAGAGASARDGDAGSDVGRGGGAEGMGGAAAAAADACKARREEEEAFIMQREQKQQEQHAQRQQARGEPGRARVRGRESPPLSVGPEVTAYEQDAAEDTAEHARRAYARARRHAPGLPQGERAVLQWLAGGQQPHMRDAVAWLRGNAALTAALSEHLTRLAESAGCESDFYERLALVARKLPRRSDDGGGGERAEGSVGGGSGSSEALGSAKACSGGGGDSKSGERARMHRAPSTASAQWASETGTADKQQQQQQQQQQQHKMHAGAGPELEARRAALMSAAAGGESGDGNMQGSEGGAQLQSTSKRRRSETT